MLPTLGSNASIELIGELLEAPTKDFTNLEYHRGAEKTFALLGSILNPQPDSIRYLFVRHAVRRNSAPPLHSIVTLSCCCDCDAPSRLASRSS